ncbi:rhodopsin, GQ-coupled-like [Dendronephthya gigantea]|uniref:rhodopsin, GQ-coupled-like n=1 Tax=Dendronephthya gigantea TaxID=151771 RepID=UPI00106C2D5C|nr:rhodopsin, GQ-coupled-like [Dendronephthya gigantea]
MKTVANMSKEDSLTNQTDVTSEGSVVANAFFVLAMLVVLIGNLSGNSMVLYVVYHQWKNVKRRVTNLLIANLACIDLLVAILVLFGIINSINLKSEMSNIKCQMGGSLSTALGAVSILTLAVISIDRYMAIVLNHGRRLKLRTVRIIIACIWVTAISISLFPILFWGKYYYSEKSTLCKPKDGGFLLFLALTCFVIPLVTMVFCYTNVFLKVHRHKKMIINSQRDNSFKTEFKTTKIVFTVLATFIVLWTPFTVIYGSSSSRGPTDTVPPGVYKFCGFLTAVHSMCNPIIYFTMIKGFRKTALKLLRRIFSCVLPPENEESIATNDSLYGDRASCSVTPLAARKIIPVQTLTNVATGDSKI